MLSVEAQPGSGREEGSGGCSGCGCFSRTSRAAGPQAPTRQPLSVSSHRIVLVPHLRMSPATTGETSLSEPSGAEQKAQGIGGTIRFGGKVQLKLPARAGLLRGSSCFPGGLQDPWSGLCPRAAVRGAPVTCQTTSQASEHSLCLAKWKPSASLCGVPGCILIANPRNKTLKENVRGGGLMSSGAWFEGSASFVPFLCCFSAELVHTWGPHTSPVRLWS